MARAQDVAFVQRTTPLPSIYPASSQITPSDRWDHCKARWGYRRSAHTVEPGLYALGTPGPTSPVLVTANYTLSFDALRAALGGRDAYILVLDTKGINVWCAAGKGTFGTDELVQRIGATQLDQVVSHRRLVLPQLGAPGVAAREVHLRTGFSVDFGPVRASDIGHYLDTGAATAAMRQVTFTARERAVLVPVEVVHHFVPMIVGAAVLWALVGVWGAVGAALAVFGGTMAFPLLLPWLPFRAFSAKGYALGLILALPSILGLLASWAYRGPAMVAAAAFAIGFPSVTAYIALNFTGATPLTSRTAVEREMRRYIPAMAIGAGLAILMILAAAIWRR